MQSDILSRHIKHLKDHYFRLEDLHIIVDNTGSKVTDEMTMVCLLFKKIVKIVICLPSKHLEFLWTRLNVSVTGVPGKKPLGARERTNNKLNPLMALTPGFLTWATLVGGSLVYIMLIGKLRHQHAMVPLAAAINTGGGYLLSLDLAFIWPEELCRSWRVLWAFVPQRPFCPKRLK